MKAVIFDMDGVLIDSEPMWKEAEKQVFSSVGVKVSEELSAKSAAMTTKEVTAFWYSYFPWSGKSLEQVENEVIDRVEALIYERGQAIGGVKEALDFFQKRNFKIGLSTNSPSQLISVVLSKLEISSYFQAISSSDEVEKGKPHPAVYLSTAKKLNVEPSKCIAIEDSFSGLMAAKKANMKTVAVPSPMEFGDEKFDISHIKLRQLSDFTEFELHKLMSDI
ncbi:hexitol phosphatase HxpB [Thiomicrorhabdus sp.]|uniref:hexitol phosphatase HxpB n=1 Tax=Thiomicrorhabdus sp. TaxID=2039724 RepID=UPI002AA8C8BD|nr:hexitol phosphatase HxpB [Thiomicrorhabdus sp.]